MELHDLDFSRFDNVLVISHKIWSKLEVLQFVRCDISDSFQNIIGAQCAKLRYLESAARISQNYSIPKFLQVNPNVQELGISAGLLLEQRNQIMATYIQLDTSI